jgi:glycosyltransferase involved in cell wall biosynthesis
MREVIDPHLGLLVPRGDRVALGALVESLLKDPDRRTRLGTQSRDWVVTRFSEDRVVDRLHEVYATLAEERA